MEGATRNRILELYQEKQIGKRDQNNEKNDIERFT